MLDVDSYHYCGYIGPSGVVTAGEEIKWTDRAHSVHQGSTFEICLGDPCIASTSPDDDGSDSSSANFYCVNGGSVGGVPGSCTCNFCDVGFQGQHCADFVVRDVVTLLDLFNALSNFETGTGSVGQDIVSAGTIIRVEPGEYTGKAPNPSATTSHMYWTQHLYFNLLCGGEPHGCVLDGKTNMGILTMQGTGGGTAIISGMTFANGSHGGGAGEKL